MSTEEKRQNLESWKEITFLGIASVFMLVILYFSVRMTMRLAEPLNAVKYGAWHAMKFDEMQKRMDDMEERIRMLEVNGKKKDVFQRWHNVRQWHNDRYRKDAEGK